MANEFNPELLMPIEPVQLFDDYYFIGNQLVGFHVLKTSQGLVLFEAMDCNDAFEKFLQPGLAKLGLANEKILMLFLTHGHFDHYQGADSVRLACGCEVALSKEDCAYMAWCDENRDKAPELPRITHLIQGGDSLCFGDHTVDVLDGKGHTPGCLNYSFAVHDGGEEHRVIMVGGYGVFGPGNYIGSYPYTTQWAVEQALDFAASQTRTWEYVKEHHCDVYLNPHPHLCDMLAMAEKNKARAPGQPNAFVIGEEGVRKWLVERFDVCLQSAADFSGIRSAYPSKTT